MIKKYNNWDKGRRTPSPTPVSYLPPLTSCFYVTCSGGWGRGNKQGNMREVKKSRNENKKKNQKIKNEQPKG